MPPVQKPEDFMDDEDLADAEEARKLQTTEFFAGLGSTAEERLQKESIMDILKTTGDTMGIKLLRKMGWRDGQGIGPRVRRPARFDEEEDPKGHRDQSTHLFAPENSAMIAFVKKNDRKGLGFEGEGRLSDPINGRNPSSANGDSARNHGTEDRIGTVSKNIKPPKRPEIRGGFGVGVLNDNGSDEEDPYQMGPQRSYSRIIGDNKKKKKTVEKAKSAANPLVGNKPVFVSKKAGVKFSTFRRCHDGRLPITGFVLSINIDSLSSTPFQDGKYRPVPVPADWKSSKNPSYSSSLATKDLQIYQSPAAIAKASTLSPKSRAALLGETPLPGKSVFNFLTPSARSRIATATNNPHLPPALSEATNTTPGLTVKPKSQNALVPALAPEIALSALGGNAAGWMPYSDDPPKFARYRHFLEFCAANATATASASPDRSTMPPPARAAGASTEDWVNEMQEFAQAAQMFKPMAGGMAKRFTSASARTIPQNTSDPTQNPSTTRADTSEPTASPSLNNKAENPAAQAAALDMFGPLTRSVTVFHPTRLLCKRFNVKPPPHVAPDPSSSSTPTPAPAASASASSSLFYPTNNSQGPGTIASLPRRRLDPSITTPIIAIESRTKGSGGMGTVAEGGGEG